MFLKKWWSPKIRVFARIFNPNIYNAIFTFDIYNGFGTEKGDSPFDIYNGFGNFL